MNKIGTKACKHDQLLVLVQLFQFAVKLLRDCMYYCSKYFAVFNTKLTTTTQTNAFLHAALQEADLGGGCRG